MFQLLNMLQAHISSGATWMQVGPSRSQALFTSPHGIVEKNMISRLLPQTKIEYNRLQ